jgi:hypothetical protein
MKSVDAFLCGDCNWNEEIVLAAMPFFSHAHELVTGLGDDLRWDAVMSEMSECDRMIG